MGTKESKEDNDEWIPSNWTKKKEKEDNQQSDVSSFGGIAIENNENKNKHKKNAHGDAITNFQNTNNRKWSKKESKNDYETPIFCPHSDCNDKEAFWFLTDYENHMQIFH